MTHRDEFRRTIGDVVGVPPGNVTLFWKGRVAGGTYRGGPNGAAAQAAFYSRQGSQPISTGLGVTRDAALARELRTLEEASREPTAAEQALLCLKAVRAIEALLEASVDRVR
jgi:hypothetical protein